MKLAVLLPGVVPDLRWFQAAARADIVVLNDLSPWSRKSRVHRYQIRTPQGTQWLNIPVLKIDHRPLNQTLIEAGSKWSHEHLRTLQMNYRNSLFFDFLEAEVESVFHKAAESPTLVDACMTTTELWTKLLEIETQFNFASELPEWDSDPDMLAKHLGATELIMEYNSRHYQRQPLHTPVLEMPHPEYRQHFGGFIPECGILDYIFSKGIGPLPR